MNFFKKIYCRAFQTVFFIALPFLPYKKPRVLLNKAEVVSVLNKAKIKRVLIVTNSSKSVIDLTNPLTNELNKKGILTFLYSEVQPNPTVDNVERGVEIYNANACNAIIAFGGGSAMDCAKAVGARIAYPNKSLSRLKGLLKVRKKLPITIACPTTAGTGSEVTLAAVITDTKKQYKYTINSFPLIPSYALLDAKVTVGLPSQLTATTGLDALTHAVEAYIGRSTTRETRTCALEATKLIFENLYTAYTTPNDLIARENMLKSAYLAGLAFTKSYVGYVHAVAHSLGGKYNVAHGLANSVLLPVVLKGYGKSVYKKLYELALYSGVCKKSDSYAVGAQKFIAKIDDLLEKMQIPKVIEEIREEDIAEMSSHADKEANPLYPVPKLFNENELQTFYYQVMKKD